MMAESVGPSGHELEATEVLDGGGCAS